MKSIFFAIAAMLLVFSCKQEIKSVEHSQSNASTLSLLTDSNPELQYENLRIYPIVADAASIASNSELAQLETMEEAMQTKGFRVMELKQFGRQKENWYNGLTVQNKSQEAVFLMSGDVVTGGNQDRVIAEDAVIAAGDLRNMPVFCVEAGRSSYYDPQAPDAEKKMAAFKGYYNVASSPVKTAVRHTGNQNEVWDAVARVTKATGAESETKAYKGLDHADEASKAKMEAYLRFFSDKFQASSQTVGMIVVCGDKVLGTEIFGHPTLFSKQFKPLLHGYAVDAAINTAPLSVSEETVKNYFEKIADFYKSEKNGTETLAKFQYKGRTLHLYSK